MFKSKKNRDSALLIFMALVMVGFLLYLFFPSSSGSENNRKIPVKKLKSGGQTAQKNEVVEQEESLFTNIRIILREYFNGVNTGDRTISEIPVDKIQKELRRSLEKNYSAEIERALKYRLRDIERALDVFKDSELSDHDKFDLYISLFLIRTGGEDIIGRSLNFTSDEVKLLLNLKHYSFINNEATENYHSIPIIIYADILIKKADIFLPGEEVMLFSQKLSDIGDISPMQHINSLKDIFSFSKEFRKFSFSWVEKDALDPDDKGEYKNIGVRRRSSFKLHYLIFPDPGDGGDYTWLKDLVQVKYSENQKKTTILLKISIWIYGETFI